MLKRHIIYWKQKLLSQGKCCLTPKGWHWQHAQFTTIPLCQDEILRRDDFGVLKESQCTIQQKNNFQRQIIVINCKRKVFQATIIILISSLYVCMAIKHIIALFVETPRKFITAVINLRGVSIKKTIIIIINLLELQDLLYNI